MLRTRSISPALDRRGVLIHSQVPQAELRSDRLLAGTPWSVAVGL